MQEKHYICPPPPTPHCRAPLTPLRLGATAAPRRRAGRSAAAPQQRPPTRARGGTLGTNRPSSARRVGLCAHRALLHAPCLYLYPCSLATVVDRAARESRTRPRQGALDQAPCRFRSPNSSRDARTQTLRWGAGRSPRPCLRVGGPQDAEPHRLTRLPVLGPRERGSRLLGFLDALHTLSTRTALTSVTTCKQKCTTLPSDMFQSCTPTAHHRSVVLRESIGIV